MSATHHLYCEETKKSVWVGQGHGTQFYLYNTEAERNQLHDFLRDHIGKGIVFDSDLDDYDDYYERENWIDERRELQSKLSEQSATLNTRIVKQGMIIRWFSGHHRFKNGVCPWCQSKNSHSDDCMYQEILSSL